jgi:threonine dehydrogenase-like Zn-dependent dehydrogenase
MQGLVFLGEGRTALREFADPVPGPGDVVVAIRASGMCGSDLRPYRQGHPEVICGHEPCGVIAERGPGVT